MMARPESLAPRASDLKRTIRVWDPAVRVFHWSLVGAFFSAYLLSDGGGAWHQALGYAAIALIGFRLVWGFIGSPYARFAHFMPSPAAFVRYLRSMLSRREPRHLGHNPAGAAMIVALLAGIAVTGITGWMMTTDALWGVGWVQDTHEWAANAVLVLVGLHVAGVLYASWRHRENLVRAMFTGRKRDE
jgi:cytochrome b